VFAQSGNGVSDWYSSTGVLGGVNLELGRQRLFADFSAQYNRFNDLTQLDNTSYSLTGGMALKTVEHLSGNVRVFGHQALSTFALFGAPLEVRNVETLSQVAADLRYGFTSHMGIEGGVDWRRIEYSFTNQRNVEETSGHIGLVWGTPGSPLNLGIALRESNGKSPYYKALIDRRSPDSDYGPVTPDEFNPRHRLTATWIPSASATVDVRITGRTRSTRDQPPPISTAYRQIQLELQAGRQLGDAPVRDRRLQPADRLGKTAAARSCRCGRHQRSTGSSRALWTGRDRQIALNAGISHTTRTFVTPANERKLRHTWTRTSLARATSACARCRSTCDFERDSRPNVSAYHRGLRGAVRACDDRRTVLLTGAAATSARTPGSRCSLGYDGHRRRRLLQQLAAGAAAHRVRHWPREPRSRPGHRDAAALARCSRRHASTRCALRGRRRRWAKASAKPLRYYATTSAACSRCCRRCSATAAAASCVQLQRDRLTARPVVPAIHRGPPAGRVEPSTAAPS
jgi:hypothetical protein